MYHFCLQSFNSYICTFLIIAEQNIQYHYVLINANSNITRVSFPAQLFRETLSANKAGCKRTTTEDFPRKSTSSPDDLIQSTLITTCRRSYVSRDALSSVWILTGRFLSKLYSLSRSNSPFFFYGASVFFVRVDVDSNEACTGERDLVREETHCSAVVRRFSLGAN